MAADPGIDPGLRASVYTWLTQVLLPGRFPEQSLAEAWSLEEVQTMLAERVKEWTRGWKEEGRQEGLEKGLQKGLQKGLEKGLEKGLQKGRQEGRQEGARAFQDFLLSEMAERFGSIPHILRRRVKGIQDLEELKKLGKRLLAATSLDDLGL
jgi:flagellar biosynthesis/type III secretory pathway protein FliH